MEISCGVGDIADILGLFLCQLPAFTLAAVDTIISTAATDQELCLAMIWNVGLKGTCSQVLKAVQHAVWLLCGISVNTLQCGEEEGEEGRGEGGGGGRDGEEEEGER